MPIFPVRSLSKYGILNDVDPYNLPTEAWSGGVNVRFRNGSIFRSPIFRTDETPLLLSTPRFITSNTPAGGTDAIVLGYLSGRVTAVSGGGGESDISISGYTNTNADTPFTSAHLGNVFYVNRGDRVPWFFRTSDSVMQTLATGLTGAWPSNYTAGLLRACGSALVAFNITKGGTNFPQMVKTSEFATSGAIPGNWDPTITGTNAIENILADMEGGITDAQNLAEIMIIYGINETWTMTPDGSTNVWAFHRIFDDAGSINANCSVEVNRTHFVFGQTDIWKHDGTSKVSICDQRNREFIFNAIDTSKLERCFVAHNQALRELYFCYPSSDALASFIGADGCNRAAVYNYVDNTWSDDDLPFVFFGSKGAVDTSVEWGTIPGTWDTTGGSWANQQAGIIKIFLYVADANSAYSLTETLYVFDLQGPGSKIALPVNTNATKGWTLLRDGIDLDDVGADLKGYKVVNSIYPQARLESGAQPITFEVGAADFFNAPITYDSPQTYDGNTLYKLDYNMPGRYLALRITHNDYHYVNLSGFDLDIDVLGRALMSVPQTNKLVAYTPQGAPIVDGITLQYLKKEFANLQNSIKSIEEIMHQLEARMITAGI